MERFIDFSKIPENIKRIKLDIGLSYNAPHSQIWFENNPENDLYIFGFDPNPDSYETIKNKNIILRNKGHSKPLENKYINDNCFQLVPIALSNNEIETSMEPLLPALHRTLLTIPLMLNKLGSWILIEVFAIHPKVEPFASFT